MANRINMNYMNATFTIVRIHYNVKFRRVLSPKLLHWKLLHFKKKLHHLRQNCFFHFVFLINKFYSLPVPLRKWETAYAWSPLE